MSKSITHVLLSLALVTVVVASLLFIPELSAFGFAFAKAVIGIWLVLFLDRFLFPEFDTHAEIKYQNPAAGLYFLGLCVLVGAALLGS